MKSFFLQKSKPNRPRYQWLQAMLPSPVKVLLNFREKALVPATTEEVQPVRRLSFHPAEKRNNRLVEPSPKP